MFESLCIPDKKLTTIEEEEEGVVGVDWENTDTTKGGWNLNNRSFFVDYGKSLKVWLCGCTLKAFLKKAIDLFENL